MSNTVAARQPMGIENFADNIEGELLQHEQVDCPVIHRFSPGLYIREVTMPAGCFAVGHYQKFPHLNIFLKGKILMFNENGTTQELTAPMIWTGKPGRKVGYIIDEVVWLNIYPTEERDIETLESTYLDKSAVFTTFYKEIREAEDRTEDREDFARMLNEMGVTEDTARSQSENEEDQIPMPDGSYCFMVSDSAIEGNGIFASRLINPGDIIGPARIQGKRTPLGRFTNHSKRPNAKMIWIGQDIYLVAIKTIPGCKGGFKGEEITTDYRVTRLLIGDALCHQ